MSSTPRFDSIISSFRARISDPATFTTGSLDNGSVVPAVDTIAYVNRALALFMEQSIEKTGADKIGLIGLLPELIATGSVTFTFGAFGGVQNGCQYIVATPYLDWFTYLDGNYQGTILRNAPREALQVIATGQNTQFVPDPSNLLLLNTGRILYLYPDNQGGNYVNVLIRYIRQPVDPTTGLVLTQNGAYDSPFYPQWTTQIAELAVGLYKSDASGL
jgi:hypothetical protein